ncbi:MAG: hypothetical protein KF782_09450 [Labilithrix sp.]|nr:hypothetical protein [Labilithrix sp.]
MRSTRVSIFLVGLAVLLGALTDTRGARADEIAPGLEGADLRARAQAELKRLVSALRDEDRRRLVGVYAAFDASAADPFAQVACDDDGDYVVVVSDAMLRLLTHVARAASYDEADGSRKVEEYAAFVARAQPLGRRLLPPPPGFHVAEGRGATYAERFAEALGFVLAHELARLRAGDLACPRPTETKERGDDDWTSAEQRGAAAIAARVYPRHQDVRDAEAVDRATEGGRSSRGALAVLRFFAELEAERARRPGGFSPTYLAHHPSASARSARLRRALEVRERAGE